MSEERDFKGVWIPKEVWLDTRLNATEKIILIEIDSLSNEEKGCYASNEYLANFCQCSERKVSEAISKLIKCEYIYVESFNGRTRILRSRLSKNERQTSKNCEAESQKMKANNNNIIIKNNNIDNNKETNNSIIIKEKEQRHKYGEYGRVLLTDEQYQKLLKEYDKTFIDDVIEKVDSYVESNDNKNNYKNFYAVIKNAIKGGWFGVKEPIKKGYDTKYDNLKGKNYF